MAACRTYVSANAVIRGLYTTLVGQWPAPERAAAEKGVVAVIMPAVAAGALARIAKGSSC